ncbi:MAG: DNA polymerase/3'-5' exonuclease PolX [Candidatus Aenigmatarchaeota archaeon]
MKNLEIARIFNDVADLLEIKDENPFRIRAYRKAAQNIESLTESIEDIAKRGELTKIPGIGKDLAQKIVEIIEKGTFEDYEKLKREIPRGLVQMLSIPSLGPKTAKLIYESLGIKTIEELEEAAKNHRLCKLPGIREKTEDNIRKGIELYKKGRERMPLGKVLPIAREFEKALLSLKEVKRLNIAGSLRRMKETIKDVDILIISYDPKEIMEFFVSLPYVSDVLAKGSTKSSILTHDGLQVDLRVVEPESFGAALQYFTGSKNHNIHLRQIADKLGLKISEYGVFDEKTGKKIAGKEEEDVYRTLGLEWIPPELREDMGEIEAAAEGKLPDLVELSDIRGDLHVHSKWSDGAHDIEEIARYAEKKGYEYVAITDHTKSLGIARGMGSEEVLEQIKEIDRINRKSKVRILKGIEVDILGDGGLDLPDEVLKRLDIVIASIHYGFKAGKDVLTKRILNAMSNPYVNIIAHPTGRLIGEREAYEVDFDIIMNEARKRNVCLEINAYPLRMDLNDILSKKAKELGVKLCINTDAHTLSQMELMEFGLAMARRGWLTKDDVINTLPLNELLKRISKRENKI